MQPPLALGTNIRLGGIYSYKLSAAAVVSSQESARREGFVSIKGIEVLSCFTSALFYCFSVSSRRSTLCPLKFFPSLVHSLNPSRCSGRDHFMIDGEFLREMRHFLGKFYFSVDSYCIVSE